MSGIISIDPLVILISALNLVVLFLIFKRFLFDRVNAVLESRKRDIEKSLSDADAKHQEAINEYNEYRRKIAASSDEARIIVNQARQNGDKIIEEARQEVKDIKVRAGEQLELDKQRAKLELHDELSEIVILAASKVVRKEIDRDANKEILEEFLVR